MPTAPTDPVAWHARDAAETLRALESSDEGLDLSQVQQRQQTHGPNRLRPPGQRSPWARFFRQFHNVLIYVLLGAALITALLGEWIDTGVILAVVVINAIIGFFQEGKAEKALEAIRQMLSLSATVIREGRRTTVPAEELVPGDIVLLESGDKVPADLRLLQVRELQIDESVLTGESVPVSKATDAVARDAALGDRFDIAFSGTLVTRGRGRGVVTAIGEATEIGRVSEMLTSVRKLTTPLLEQIARFGRVLSAAIILLAGATFAFGVLFWHSPWMEMFLAAVGLAVAAIPEGLPAILTITLAVGVQRMARRHAIIRHLPAVDTLGSVTVICSDKTGTLTRNEMTVRTIATGDERIDVTGVGYAPEGGFERDGAPLPLDQSRHLGRLLHAALLCNDARLHHDAGQWQLEGDPTEGALLTLARKGELDPEQENRHWPRTDAIPFESEHRFMATLHHSHTGEGVVYVKGATERVLEMCTQQQAGEHPAPIDRTHWQQQEERLASQGQRVLALAYKPTRDEHVELTFADVEQGLILLGLVGLIDPPRDEAIAAVGECQQAGIRVKMITGDHALTARAIGAQLGLDRNESALVGRELDQLDDAALRRRVEEVDVYARVSPEHKLRLVQAIQANGHVVAMTGDGVNDAPALKRADVGVAMGRKGTEVSKEAADMVLADDNFASIAHAVEEGRAVYANIQKAILFMLPTNGAEALVIVAAVGMGFMLPITPVQILWVNMVTAVTLALALAFEPPEAGAMRRPPRRPREPLLSGFFLWRIGFVAVLLWLATYGLFLWVRQDSGELALARTAAVNMLVMGEIVYLLNTRYLKRPVLNAEGLLGNRYALGAIALVLVLQGLYTYLPWSQRLFETAGLAWPHWLAIVSMGVVVLLLVELEKWFLRRRDARRAAKSSGGH
ncbi:MAG: cation-transporting P-type ATPase [Phycisphaeraceae bacterium]